MSGREASNNSDIWKSVGIPVIVAIVGLVATFIVWVISKTGDTVLQRRSMDNNGLTFISSIVLNGKPETQFKRKLQ
jgi:hypothetical protein